jgi:hypothetical protein
LPVPLFCPAEAGVDPGVVVFDLGVVVRSLPLALPDDEPAPEDDEDMPGAVPPDWDWAIDGAAAEASTPEIARLMIVSLLKVMCSPKNLCEPYLSAQSL